MDKKFSISVISKACGILPHTLRAWESRYSMFTPDRDESGKRVYSENDLKKAVFLASLVEHGHSISGLAKYSLAELENLAESMNLNEKNKSHNNGDLNSKNLLKHLEAYKIEMVSKELQHIRENTGVKEFILETILPMMREVGLLVASGKYTVTQEHIMSTIVRDQLSQINLPSFDSKTTQISIATPEGNLHELAISIANILCRSHKISTRYLGAAHPANCLAEAVNILNTPILVLGAVTSDSWNYTERIIPFLQEINDHLKVDLTVVLGGGVKLDFPKFSKISKVIVMPTFDEFEDYLKTVY